SKLVLISGAAQPVVKIEQLKGKALVPEMAELNLTDLIDLKGMKAMGNRLSVHQIKSVELIAEHDDAEDVPDPAPDTVEETEIIITSEDKQVADAEPAATTQLTADTTVEDKPVEPTKSVESPDTSVESPKKKVDFEITNPDDIDIDDTGQLGLF
ncbi:MAG: topoisomerase, partial [Mucilaginibacter sp.]|nr:topoisomerase [Mucilaginibacter sp.]